LNNIVEYQLKNALQKVEGSLKNKQKSLFSR